MPFPSVEDVRVAVEKQLHDGLAAMPGDWIGTLSDGREVEFRPSENGEIALEFCLSDEEMDRCRSDEPVEKTYKFRIRVEIVE